jgi:hypothetical protein
MSGAQLSLPTLSPTTLPPLLALLSLRSELGSVARVWTSARRSLECLEFVRRRWGAAAGTSAAASPDQKRPRQEPRWRAPTPEEVRCAICFENVHPSASPDEQAKEAQPTAPDETCMLDCGHELHSLCLVRWLAAQAFCPVCHLRLSASPPSTASRTRRERVA